MKVEYLFSFHLRRGRLQSAFLLELDDDRGHVITTRSVTGRVRRQAVVE